MTRVALYSRVSTDEQTTENQLRELRDIAEHRKWRIVDEFTDEGISGAKGREDRPGLDAMLKAAMKHKFDTVMCWHIDRLGRSLISLIDTMNDLKQAGVGLYIHLQNLDTNTASGKAMYQMLGVFAEFERSLISERVMAGMARAKAEGKRQGRRPLEEAKPELYARVKEMLEAGEKPWAVHVATRAGHSTVLRIYAGLQPVTNHQQGETDDVHSEGGDAGRGGDFVPTL